MIVDLTVLGWILLAAPVVMFVYAYGVYPALLWLVGMVRRQTPVVVDDPDPWPFISISLPAYNEEASIGRAVESLLALDYPPDRREIVVISDASTDGTDEVVRRYADRGVTLLRLPARGGKTAAENFAAPELRGEIVVNTDATIRILPGSLKPLIRVFQDPAIGVASGRDLSVGSLEAEANRGESSYVGYEMGVRALETRVGSIVGASGCFYAIRRELHRNLFPAALSRDFASALISREHGFRAVSVDAAVCLVPRAGSLQAEYRRKTRTMARGLDTLWYKRHLMNPFRYGLFAWMLISHKLCRWLMLLAGPGAMLGLILLSFGHPLVALPATGALIVTTLGLAALRWPDHRPIPRPLAFCGFFVLANAAGFLAWLKALRGERNPIWEPTRRPA